MLFAIPGIGSSPSPSVNEHSHNGCLHSWYSSFCEADRSIACIASRGSKIQKKHSLYYCLYHAGNSLHSCIVQYWCCKHEKNSLHLIRAVCSQFSPSGATGNVSPLYCMVEYGQLHCRDAITWTTMAKVLAS
jgi:hypothetical protein